MSTICSSTWLFTALPGLSNVEAIKVVIYGFPFQYFIVHVDFEFKMTLMWSYSGATLRQNNWKDTATEEGKTEQEKFHPKIIMILGFS